MSVMRNFLGWISGFLFAVPFMTSAWALELDWSGQFRSEAHYVRNYSMDTSAAGIGKDPARVNAGGFYIPGGGSHNAAFQTLFFRLRPKLVVNDNIYVKSEWWVGDPIYGFFGGGLPYTSDQRQFFSTQSRGSAISAQRYWGEFVSDVGTVHVGRAPLHWGLGLIWNSGDGLWDRYQSTGDVIRLVSKFGAFTVSPSIIKYSMGNAVGGSCSMNLATGTCDVLPGGGGVSEYSLSFKYENPDEDFEGGVIFMKRIAGAAQDPAAGYFGPTQVVGGSHYNTWDIYGRKKFGRFSIAGEAPIISGNVGGIDYTTYALALESGLKIGQSWDISLKAGRAPGQPNFVGQAPARFKAFFFNPNYRLGMIMFNYQLANFAGPNTTNNVAATTQLASPFDNPVVNANYLAATTGVQLDKWNLQFGVVYAQAIEAAESGASFYNYWRRNYFGPAVTAQEKAMGWEFDLGTTFKWDDNFVLGLDLGAFLPGGYFKFSNLAAENPTSAILAGALRLGVVF